MECLLSSCLYIAGALGMQGGYEMADNGHYRATRRKTNDYGLLVGRLSLIAEYNYLYAELLHVSGINTSESDIGLNAAMAGIKLDHNSFYAKLGAGVQVQLGEELETNQYGDILVEAAVGVNFGDGMFVQGSIIDDMSSIVIGMSSHF